VSTARPVQVVAGKKGAGRVNPRPNANGVQVVFPNITPDMETGAGTWTDEQFERAIRHGIGHDGRTLVANMPYRFFNAMSDEDLASVVVYIRSIPAVRNALPKIVVPPQVAATLAPLPDAGSPPPPGIPVFSPALLLSFTRGEPSPAAKRGAYLATLGQCAGCHSTAKGGQRVPGFAFAGTGGFTPRIPPKGAADTFRIASMNLTPDPSGIPYYDEGVFLKTIRSGAVNGVRNLDTVMPWSWFRNMTESDLKDVFAYLKGLQPVVHHVDNREPPTLCPIDGQMHGFGDHNHVVASTASR
jgi:mono/diheme cytochrome c family protein